MRRAIVAALGATALALPNASAWASATAQTAKTKVVVKTKTFTGLSSVIDRWGFMQVTIVVRKTTTTNLATKKKSVRRRISSVRVPIYPNHTDRSVYINQTALPILIRETISSNGSAVNMVSGATESSDGFAQSLHSAILQARSW